VFDARILPDFGKKKRFFYSLNALHSGVVMLATFVRFFAKKVTAVLVLLSCLLEQPF